MSAKQQLASQTAALTLAFALSLIPGIHTFALQGFAIVVLIFFALKRLKKQKIHHIIPDSDSLEMALLTFGFFFLIACTGTVNSPFFVLSFIHLFFLSLSTSPLVSLVVVTETIILYVVQNHQLTSQELFSLLPLPLTLVIFIFARQQYGELQKTTHILEKESQELVDTKRAELSFEQYLSSSLTPQLITLKSMITSENTSVESILNQITLIEEATQAIIEKIKKTE